MLAFIQHLWFYLNQQSFEPFCGLHHLMHSNHGESASPPDPHITAFIISVLIGGLTTIGLLLFGGPLLVIWVRRVRHLFWMIPSANLAMYLVSVALRSYPGGLALVFNHRVYGIRS